MMKAIPGVRMHSFDAPFSNSSGGIRYRVPVEKDDEGLDIWCPSAQSPLPLVTTLEVRSGGGKTTLANRLVSFLAGQNEAPGAFSWSREPEPNYGVSMLPQRSSTVLHWKVGNVLPVESRVLPCLIPDEDINALQRRYLSELSGGQITRVLLASALERALASKLEVYYLLLDEPFDGLDQKTGNDVLRKLLTLAEAAEKAPTIRFLLISHFDPAIGLHDVPCRRLSITPTDSIQDTSNIKFARYREVIVNEAA